AIRLPDGSIEPVHGHNWPVEVTVSAEKLDEIETVMDFHELESLLDTLLEKVNNRHLNEVEPFGTTVHKVNPTAERIAWWIGSELQKQLPEHVRLMHIRIGEALGCYAKWTPER